jgi:hypothetical protein
MGEFWLGWYTVALHDNLKGLTLFHNHQPVSKMRQQTQNPHHVICSPQ